MAGKTLKELPGWVNAILVAWGADVSKALEKVNELLAKVDAPAELRERLAALFTEMAVVSDPIALQMVVAGIVLEVTSGQPGFNPSHGGLA